MYEKLVIGLPSVFSNPGSFLEAECVSKAWKDIWSLYTLVDTLSHL